MQTVISVIPMAPRTPRDAELFIAQQQTMVAAAPEFPCRAGAR